MMSERVPGDHYTLVRNPRYYRASEGLPYLDKFIIHIAPTTETILKDLQAGSIDSYDSINNPDVGNNPQAFQRLSGYTLVRPPTSSYFLGLFFNFANTVLATHVEVREAMAMAIDHPALITVVHGFAESICTDHGSFYHPGYEGNANCPSFDPTAANKLLDDNGWVKGPDGVRSKNGQRLEFELSTNVNAPVRFENEVMVQHNLSVIGIKLDIQNYGVETFFGSFLPEGKPSPPTGAVAGRFDIAEWAQGPSNYDPDDSGFLPCDQNIQHYCNPALDALYKQERETTDLGLRQQLFYQIHHIYLTDFPFITLYFPLDGAVVRKGTHNYQPSPFTGETVKIWEWWCDNGKC
jgi:peptide/nickel transport system substrate-binding protein